MSPARQLKVGLAFIALCFMGIGNTWAYHRHGHFGVVIDPWPHYYRPYTPYYYPPTYYPPVIVQPPPTVYIEQQVTPPPAAAPQPSYWYYCPSSKAYYPYVKKCRADWIKVLPQQP